jgi:hypothetical protein
MSSSNVSRSAAVKPAENDRTATIGLFLRFKNITYLLIPWSRVFLEKRTGS